jgi:hypothetical protein
MLQGVMMSISLSYLIQRNKTNLKNFLQVNNIKSYPELVSYCESKGCEPVSEELYAASAPFEPGPAKEEEVLPSQKKVVKSANEKQTKNRKTSARTRSSTSKTRKRRSTRDDN